MRFFFLLPLLAVVSTPAVAQAQAAQTASPAAKSAYTTADTELGTLLDDPAAKAVLAKYIPEFIGNEQISMARGLTLKALQQYASEALSDATLAKIDADLAKLPAK